MPLPFDLDRDSVRRAVELTGGNPNIFADDSYPQERPSDQNAPLGSIASTRSAVPAPLPAPLPPSGPSESFDEPAGYSEGPVEAASDVRNFSEYTRDARSPEESLPVAAAVQAGREPTPAGPPAPPPAPAGEPPPAPVAEASGPQIRNERPDGSREELDTDGVWRRYYPPSARGARSSDQDIEDRVFNRGDSTRSMQQQYQDGQNRALELTEQTKGGIQAEGLAQAGNTLRELQGHQQERREDMEGRIAMNREQKQAFEDRMVRKVDELSSKMRNPPKDTMAMVMGIIGMVMSAKGNAKGAALAQGIGQAFATKTRQWAAGIEADQEEMKNLRGLFDMQNTDSESELRQEAAMSTQLVAEFNTALDAIKAETGSKEAAATAEAAKLDLRQRYVAHQMDIRARAIAAQREREIYQTLGRAETPKLRADLAHQIGPDGDRVLQNMSKTEKGLADIDVAVSQAEQNRAAAFKAMNGREPGEEKYAGPGESVIGGYQVANPDIWNSLERPTKAKFQQGAAAIPELNRQLQEYASLLRRHGTENLPTEAKGLLQAKHAAILGKVKEAAELGALDNGVIALVDRMIGDPTAWNLGLGNVWENADVRAEETRKAILQEAATKAKAYGLSMQPGAAGISFKPAGQ